MRRDADLLAHLEQGARRASGLRTSTDVLAKRNQQSIYLDPVRSWQFLLEYLHRLLRCLRHNQPPAVRHPVNMDIDADEWEIAGDPERQVRALRTDALERK